MVKTDKAAYAFIGDNLKRVREDIEKAAALHGRKAEDINLIGVSKTQPAEAIIAAWEAGLRHFGENRVEELLPKLQDVRLNNLDAAWHMIGNLQRRKVRRLVGLTDLIHSVNSIRLLEEIASRAEQAGSTENILFEVNASEEASKMGFSPQEIEELKEISSDLLKNVRIRGVMSMAPFTEDQYIIEKTFEKTAGIFWDLAPAFKEEDFTVLSMGMSNDYPLAIKHGASDLRIGTAIFGQRISL